MDRDQNVITASEFGKKIRSVDLFANYERSNGNELFYSIERRNHDKNIKDNFGRVATFLPTKEYGYIDMPEELKEFTKSGNGFFTGCSGVEFIEWDPKAQYPDGVWNVVFEEKSIIGSVSFKMTPEEFEKFHNNIDNISHTLLDDIKTVLESLDTQKVVNLYNEYAEANSYERITTIDDLRAWAGSDRLLDLALNDQIDLKDKYFTYNGLGKEVSFSNIHDPHSPIDLNDLATFIENKMDGFGIDELEELIDEYEADNEEELDI